MSLKKHHYNERVAAILRRLRKPTHSKEDSGQPKINTFMKKKKKELHVITSVVHERLAKVN